MADARQRSDWLKVGVAVAELVNRGGFAKQALDPLKVIPPQFRPRPDPPPELTDEEEAEGRRAAWSKFDAAFGLKG